MERLMIFSETNIYILSKLVALLRRHTGHRHRLNSQTAINQLINEAARQSDPHIQTFYRRFLDNLTPEQRASLAASGVHFPAEPTHAPGTARLAAKR
ncbi:MAG: hypothetical protein ACX931_11410 [Saccharospirillum sp.]